MKLWSPPVDHIMPRFRIRELVYKISDAPIQVGDMVLDRRNFTTGVAEYISDGHMAVRDGCVVELLVPISCCYNLQITNPFNNN